MLQSKLKEIQKKAQEGTATLNDVIEITSEAFLSQSAHFKKIEATLANILETLEKLNSPIFQVVEDEEE